MPSNPPMMQCGHAANSEYEIDGVKHPCCVICFQGVGSPAAKIARDTPDLTGRRAMCKDCHRTTASSFALPFFHHDTTHNYDSYYCGCRGWD
jgi:hypothetical protein